jgi:hypothetical protein
VELLMKHLPTTLIALYSSFAGPNAASKSNPCHFVALVAEWSMTDCFDPCFLGIGLLFID